MINRIEGPSSLRPTTTIRRPTKTGGSSDASFSKHLEETEESSGLHNTAALSSVSSMLDLQEVDDALARAAKGKLRAEDMLDQLDALRLDLLSGTISTSKLQRLSDVVQSHREEVSDPRLSEILDEIDLRAQVELAKFTRDAL